MQSGISFALTTGCTTFVVIVAKFTEGAWLTVLAIPGLVWLMSAVHHHYERIESEAESSGPAHLKDIPRPIVILPLQRWDKVSEKALQFAYTLSRDLVVVHIAPKDQDGTSLTDEARCPQLRPCCAASIRVPSRRNHQFVYRQARTFG
jgi:hypothetical protein